MKIRVNDIHRQQKTKYDFSKEYVSGKILDITYGKYFDYEKSRLLLENGAKEVWSFDLLEKTKHIALREKYNDKIIFKLKNKDELETKIFDSIIAFNIISVSNDVEQIMKFISEHLILNGVAIFSIVNDDDSFDFSNNSLPGEIHIFSKTEFENILKKFFNEITFFSQGTILHNKPVKEHKNMIKLLLRNFFLKSVNRLDFYLKYVRPMQISIEKSHREIKQKSLKKYDIFPFETKHKPEFILAVCKK
ncbi:glycosyltransferase protein [Marine Group I thaumarchaeote SCGC AAA799-E16]|uniref:Uncharacterized protein n=2 Tax=Marine Group I TaxID=905826 RepID=A0A087S252_9ARCH|nr:glycosyltransferase protein [Marine Group I thaumarchaeote SCGC AAA799-E16]KFM19806.1 hypothetical protein SCCGRSA3_00336 [Marine Group I thaumarchaeote SCGC RSA3]